MTDSIYLVGGDGKLTPAGRTPYRLEDDLQKLLADNPELLPGEQIDPESPRRWRLIRREAGVGPSEESGRWSLDHLFVDQEGIPTLVEAKRGGNPEARRDVVAQLIEYAANGSLYWPVDRLRDWFEQHAQGHDEAVASIASLLEEDDPDSREERYEAFWNLVGNNLRDRRIRLIFVADEIPMELKTLVEFLNEEMSRVEVLAVEVVQFAGSGNQFLMPRLVGQTSKAVAAKQRTKRAPSRDTSWTEQEILDILEQASEVARARAERLLAWAHEQRLLVQGNRGLTYPTLHVRLPLPGGLLTVFSLYSDPKYLLEIPVGTICTRPPLADPSARAALHASLAPLTQMAKGDPATEQYAYAGMDRLKAEDHVDALLSIIHGYTDALRHAHAAY